MAVPIVPTDSRMLVVSALKRVVPAAFWILKAVVESEVLETVAVLAVSPTELDKEPLVINTDEEFDVVFVVTRSRRPSPSMSPESIPCGDTAVLTSAPVV